MEIIKSGKEPKEEKKGKDESLIRHLNAEELEDLKFFTGMALSGLMSHQLRIPDLGVNGGFRLTTLNSKVAAAKAANAAMEQLNIFKSIKKNGVQVFKAVVPEGEAKA